MMLSLVTDKSLFAIVLNMDKVLTAWLIGERACSITAHYRGGIRSTVVAHCHYCFVFISEWHLGGICGSALDCWTTG